MNGQDPPLGSHNPSKIAQMKLKIVTIIIFLALSESFSKLSGLQILYNKIIMLSKNISEVQKIKGKNDIWYWTHTAPWDLPRGCFMGNEYAVSIYDGHKEEWTLMGFSAQGWCYAPLLLNTFIAQTTVPTPLWGVHGLSPTAAESDPSASMPTRL